MDNDDIIADYLEGKDIDPQGYDPYQIERLKQFVGYDEDESSHDSLNQNKNDYGDFGEDGCHNIDEDE